MAITYPHHTFTSVELEILPDRITWFGNPMNGLLDYTELKGFQDNVVMHEWESELMKLHADYIAETKGHILEIGFGMGISAGFIHDNNPMSHTIIELHPQIAEIAREWAQDKPDVTIIEGDWYTVLPTLTEGSIQITPRKFDGIFFDPYGQWSRWNMFAEQVKQHTKNTTRLSHWNAAPGPRGFCGFGKDSYYNVSYTEYEVDPPQNDYFNNDIYYLPKVTVDG
jgi:hypothetical protein